MLKKTTVFPAAFSISLLLAGSALAQSANNEAPAPIPDPMTPTPWQVETRAKTPEPIADPLVKPVDAKDEQEAYADERGTFSITFENDVFTGRDDGYTNGFRASWTTGADKVPVVIDTLARAIPTFPLEGNKRISYGFGQSMFTASDIEAYTLQEQDRPYAGWLYGSVGLISDTGSQYDTLELTLGVVGPAAMAKHSQRLIHQHVTDSPEPRGWYHQLKNEPGVMLSYDRKWRSYYQFSTFGHGVDFTPHIGTSLGNVMTDAKVGGTVRIGRNLPSDYGPPRVRPSVSGSDFFIPTRNFSWYLFAGVEGRYVARNIFLDGNTFRDSHSVDKEHWVGDAQMGLALTYDSWRVAYTHVFRTREYEEQENAESFGAFTVSRQF